MKAKIKSIHNSEIDDLKNFQPAQSDNFCILFSMLIGPENGEGEESFDIQICTPKWLASVLKENETLFGRHFLIALNDNYQVIYKKITDAVESYTGTNWKELAEKIARFGYWEFEDYQE